MGTTHRTVISGRAGCLVLLLVPAAAAADCWLAVPEASDVRFAATQAGAPIEGTFREFSARICIDSAQPAASHIDVTIDTASVDMGLPEFDAEMRGPDFFDSARWPVARFTGTGVQALGGGRFTTTGKFTIRDRTRDVQVSFTLADDTIRGQLKLQRLDYDIGLGQWRDTRWVGNDVDLRFRVTLKPEPGAGAVAPGP